MKKTSGTKPFRTPTSRTRRRRRLLSAYGGLAVALVAVLGQPTRAATVTCAIVLPAVPPDLQVPAPNIAFLEGHATGTQDYICLPSGSSVAWAFVEPQATLLDDHDEQIITHFLSPNPVESGTPRATWQHSDDTSTVWANKIAASSDANFVASGAIPWLLLQVVGLQTGPTSGDTLAATTFIQRLNTSGGVAPATGCAQPADVGNKALVPYSADYFFFSVPECVGDCNGDGQVTVDELVTMVNVGLGLDGIDTCLAGDANHDGQITVDEILKAMAEALGRMNMC